MRSFRWLFVTAAVIIGLLIIAIAVGSIWLNSFIHSAAFKKEVETRASQSVGCPVQIQSVDFDVLHGVKLQGLVTQLDPAHAGGQGALKVQIGSVDCTYSLFDLLRGRLRLTGLTLDSPQVDLTKQPTPRYPAQPPSPGGSPAPGNGVVAGGSSGSLPFQFELDRVKVNNGAVTVRDAIGAPMFDLHGLNADADTSGYYDGHDVTGHVKIAAVTNPGVILVAFSTPFTYHQNYFSAKPFEAGAFGGNIGGYYLLDASQGPSVLDVNGKGFKMDQVMEALSPGSSAKLTGSLDLQSKWRAVETGAMAGEGDAQFTNGQLHGVRVLNDVASILKIKELNDPVINSARSHFLVENRSVHFIGLQVESPGFRITGGGLLGFDGSLNANLVLILGRDAMSRMPKELASSFVQTPDGGGSISFRVTGTTSDPKTDLPERMLMQNTQIKNVINKALNNFFH